MPLFYTHNINENTRLAVWHITEDEEFFRKINISHRLISHPHKRLQHLSGRYLLKIMDPDFPVNRIKLDGRRPYLDNNSYYFSISHCGDYAAAILSKDHPVGIDVELITDKIGMIETKFLNEKESELLRDKISDQELPRMLTACWSAKESMFKWYALGNVSFRQDMLIKDIRLKNDGSGRFETFFGKEKETSLQIDFCFFDDLCLAWVK